MRGAFLIIIPACQLGRRRGGINNGSWNQLYAKEERMDHLEKQKKKETDFIPPFCVRPGDTTAVVGGYDNLSWGEALDSLIKLKGVFPRENFFMVDEAGTVVFSLDKDLGNEEA
jgi:hypothetical protein